MMPSSSQSNQEWQCQAPDELESISLEFGHLGCHLLADFYDCTRMPTDTAQLESLMVSAAEASKATIVESTFHSFSPIGLSGVVVIAESHLACHTWPEYQTACVDFFSCSDQIEMITAVKLLWNSLGASSVTIKNLGRGNKPADR